MLYTYKAIDNDGRRVSGQVQASNIEDLELRLRRMNLDLINYHSKQGFALNLRRVNRQEMVTFCIYMEQITRAGVPLVVGLEDLRDSMQQSYFREIVASIIEDIEGGQQLSEAMARFPKAFDTVFISLVRVGEESGQLDKIFNHLSENIKWQDELVAHTKKLLTYPAIVGTVVTFVIVFVMTYLVPQLIQFIQTMEHEMPFHTKLLIDTSHILTHYWHFILPIPFALLFLFFVFYKLSAAFRYWWDGFKLHVWVLGPIFKKLILARFASFFSLMFSSGITVLESLRLTEDIVSNLVVQVALREVRQRISEGMSISESFNQSTLFPPLVLRMISIGESTGELDSALSNISYFYNREVKESIDRMQTLVEPTMILVLGLILGWVMMSVLGPIYDIMGSIQP